MLETSIKIPVAIIVTSALAKGLIKITTPNAIVSNAAIKANSIIDIFAEDGLSYTNATSTVGSVTITYPAQETDVGIVVILL